MQAAMTRPVIPSLLLAGLAGLAACSGGSGKPTQPVLPGTGAGTGAGTADPVAADPHLAGRLAFANPGGMWMPRQMDLPQHRAAFEAMGVELDVAALRDPQAAPLDAIVSLEVCTGSFVSPDGLVITNQHCVQDALQANSTADNDRVEQGFLAATRGDELPANPGQRILVTQASRDVTAEITDGLAAITDDGKRKRTVDDRIKLLVAACEQDRPGIECSVESFFRGAEFQLIESLAIVDVRLVYVPHRAVGNYGGEIDNWAWPRHTGDFAFFRAYVGKDGKPAPYAQDNVPYRPRTWLKIAKQGLAEHDFVMVAGYPGRTNRLDTLSEVQHDIDFTYPYLIEFLQQYYDLLEELGKAGGETALKAGVAKHGIQNALENQQGVLAGLTSSDLLAQKKVLDDKVRAWAAVAGREAYATAIAEFDLLLAEDFKKAKGNFDLGTTLNSAMLGEAMFFVQLAEERAKPDVERKPAFQDRVMPQHVAAQQGFGFGYDAAMDRGVFKLGLRRAMTLPEDERPWLRTILGVKKGVKIDAALIDKVVDALYAKTKLADLPTRMALLEKGTTKQLAKSKDPFIKLARALRPLMKAREDEREARSGRLLLLSSKFAVAMREALDGFLAPDANSTLRVTYGTVKPFKPGEPAFTRATEIPAKDTGELPYDAPKPLLAAVAAASWGPYAAAALGAVPVDFLSDLDTTGGNSGSPTLNGRGELVGLAFDGTLAGVASDVVFDGRVTRAIHVDIRYALWVMDALDGADALLAELGVKPAL